MAVAVVECTLNADKLHVKSEVYGPRSTVWTVSAHRLPEFLGFYPMSAQDLKDTSTQDCHFVSAACLNGVAMLRMGRSTFENT